MRQRLKLVFLILLTVSGAIVWQNDDAKTRFFRELETVRDFINHLASGYEPWQVWNHSVTIFYGDMR